MTTAAMMRAHDVSGLRPAPAGLLVGLGLLFWSSPVSKSEEFEIQSVVAGEDGMIHLGIDGPAGEMLVESTEDLETWTPSLPLGSNGGPVMIEDARTAANKFYRLLGFPDTDDQHLDGPLAQQLRAGVPYTGLQSVFGLGAGPPAMPVTLVRDLPTATSEQRAYAAAIAVLSILGRELLDTVVPQPSLAEVVAALVADLASGSLNGRDSGGARVAVGTGGALLPEYTDQDLADAVSQLDGELSGLRNVELSAGGGQFSTAVPADWNTFYWDSSEWQ